MAVTSRSPVAVLWSLRRWVYGAWVLVSVGRIPARTGFHLVAPACDARLTLANAGLSLTKVPHVVLFGLFCLLTLLQFDRIDRRAAGWSLAATGAIGLLVELEEGATRTGNCRLTDVLPDFVGGVIAVALVAAFLVARRSLFARPAADEVT